MKIIYFILISLLFSSFDLNSQEILKQKMSGCDSEKRPDIIKDRIIESAFKGGVLQLKVGFSENCSFDPVAKLKVIDDTLFLSLAQNSMMRAMCDCCFEMDLDIEILKNPKVIMLQKNFFNLNAEFREIQLSKQWHHKFVMDTIDFNKETSKDSLYYNRFYTFKNNPNKCTEKPSEFEVRKSILADSVPNVSVVVADLCSEPIVFAKVVLFETDGNDKVGKPIQGYETSFNGEVSFRINPGLFFIEVRPLDYKPREFFIDVPRDSSIVCKSYCSKPQEIEVFDFHSTKKLSLDEFNLIAKRIWLERGVSDSLIEEFSFLR